jgi:hypothetical protein
VIGLAFGTTPNVTLDAIARAGRTGSARLANNAGDLAAALSYIAQSSVLVEKCNKADEDCNGVVDDCTPFVPNSCCP